jgi:hypothetical protein
MKPHPEARNPNQLNSKAKERGRKEPHIASTVIFSNLFYRSGKKIIK